MGKIYMIIGKSASGKDHIYQSIAEDKALDLKKFVTYTTRPKREGEEHGKEYFFSNQTQLQEFRDQGKIIEERVYDTIFGPWYYYTADDGQIQTQKYDYITIGTLESYISMKQYFEEGVLCPVYIEVEDGTRLIRAIIREQKQQEPGYREVCRRFIADAEDFSEKRLEEAGIQKRFYNNDRIEDCIEEIRDYIMNNKGCVK